MRPFHRQPGGIVAILLLCLLAACSRGQISRDTAFGAQDEGGLVVVGLTTNADAQRKPPTLFWTAYEPVSGELGLDYKIVGDRTDDALAQIDPTRMIWKDPGGHRYLVFALPAGDWILERVFATVQAPMYEPYTVDDVLDHATVAITVASGEAVYVGEIGYDRTPRSILTLDFKSGDFAAAKAHMATFPGVSAALVDRPMRPASFTCNRFGERLAIAYCAPKAPRPLP